MGLTVGSATARRLVQPAKAVEPKAVTLERFMFVRLVQPSKADGPKAVTLERSMFVRLVQP